MTFRNRHLFACLEAGQPGICFVMRNVQTRDLILMPSLQPRGTKYFAGLFASDELRNGLAQHPVRRSTFGICQPFQAVEHVLIKFNGNRASSVHRASPYRLRTHQR